MTNTPADDPRDNQAVTPEVKKLPAKARTLKQADAKKATPKPKANKPGAVKWIMRSGNKETPVADWARAQGHKPFDVRQALRKAIGAPRVVTQAELTAAMSKK